METENKVVRYLIETKKEATIRELAIGIKSDYKITHVAAKRLIKKGVLEGRKIGKSIQTKLSNKLGKEVLEVEFERREEALKNKNISMMLETLRGNLKTVNFALILFGSYAKNKADKHSDIDMIFIADKKYEKSIEQALSILPLKMHYFVFSEQEFRNMNNTREINVVKEAIKNNVILHGIEQYYELIK